jgi:hypothetical protein
MKTLQQYARECYENSKSKGFHDDDEGVPQKYVIAMKLDLMHSELAEALEEIRAGKAVDEVYYNPDKPEKPEGFLPEVADTFIRIMDMIGSLGLEEEFPKVVDEKMKYNSTRPFKHGKQF